MEKGKHWLKRLEAYLIKARRGMWVILQRGCGGTSEEHRRNCCGRLPAFQAMQVNQCLGASSLLTHQRMQKENKGQQGRTAVHDEGSDRRAQQGAPLLSVSQAGRQRGVVVQWGMDRFQI